MSANPNFRYVPPMSPYLDIIYQDNDIVVLNKASGILSVPGRLPEHQDCLQLRVQRILPSATIVHRLDMATSGVMVMALNKSAHVSISRQFEQRQTKKCYLARVLGLVELDTGNVNLPLICDWPNRPKQKVDFENGKQSLTHYRVLSRQEPANEAASSLIELTPVTGRSHQLRVHMLSLGHPILGDKLYAPETALTMRDRLQLHALTLNLLHPVSGKSLNFHAPCPFN
jgi:tRNA pseudouridine32 synthase/23S rRNA pseudouridine746 synthase